MNLVEMKNYKRLHNMHRILDMIKVSNFSSIEVTESEIEKHEVEELRSLGYTVDWEWGGNINYYVISGW